MSFIIMSKKRKINKSSEKKKRSGNKTADGKLILEWLKAREGDSFLKELFEELGDVMDNASLNEQLILLETAGKIDIQKRGLIRLANNRISAERQRRGNPHQVRGIADLTMSGAAYVIVDGMESDVFIPPRKTLNAMQGDEVLVGITRGGKRIEGEILEILRHSQESFLGRIELLQQFAFCIPEQSSLKTDIFIPLDKLKGAGHRQRVIVRVTDWQSGGKNPVGEVTEMVSEGISSDLEYKMILIRNGFHPEFPKSVELQVSRIAEQIPREEIGRRIDLRGAVTFTIDPEDAKDFDDAISVRKPEEGGWEVGVHIADVSHYLEENSPMDKEARMRATSVYLPGKVCPMLPEKLSNLICSLRPKEDKLTFSVLFYLDDELRVSGFRIAETVIHSRKRFSYEEAQKILESGEGVFSDELKLLKKLADKLRAKRFENGAIAFEKPEVRFRLDEQGWPVDVYTKERKDAHLLIEDLMLLANETVARWASSPKMRKTKPLFVYRVHDKPDPAKLEQFSNIAGRFGYQIKFDKNSRVAEIFNTLLKKVEGKPEQHVLETLAIRSMAKAAYTIKNIGHYGLAMSHYTHFTSPIRRYPDVMVHRLLKQLLGEDEHLPEPAELEAECKKSSAMERKAMDAEWEAIRLKQVQYLQDKQGMEFDAIISGVISKGIFAEIIENKCEGFISLEALGPGTFVYDERNLWLSGPGGKRYALGSPIRIKVGSADPVFRRMDFLPV